MASHLIPDDLCACGSVLIPRRFAKQPSPPHADYVCLRCGEPYRWTGNPRRLMPLSAATVGDDDED